MEIQSDPDQRQLQIIQQQISRTGVMVNSGFSNADQPQISPLNLTGNQFNSNSFSLNFKEDQFSGDFLRSRNQQGFYLRTVRPTRSRIELKNAGSNKKPQLASLLEFPVKNLYYIDSSGTVWATPLDETIKPG